MPYTLEHFAADLHEALKRDAGPAGRETVRRLTEKAVSDRDFVAAFLGPHRTAKREILYQDPELEFCICAHVDDGQGKSGPPPHDHGPTWAIYGQAVGVTRMTEWRIVEPAKDGEKGLVEEIETYDLTPGTARLYDIGIVHSPVRGGATRFIRIEGRNQDGIKRATYRPVDRTTVR
jgi:hypothetical protein